MRLARVKVGYEQKYTEEQQRLMSPAFLLETPTFDAEGAFEKWYQTQVVDLDRWPQIVGKLEVEEFIFTPPELQSIGSPRDPSLNQMVNVVVPGNELMRIKEVTVEEDCCTNRLQELLNGGWCILAICPQPDQRRPDYVLGRRDHEG